MKNKFLSVFRTLFASLSFGSSKRNLIIDHDAGVDDLASIAIAILSGNFNVRAITICPADSFKAPAIQTTLGLIRFLDAKNIEVAAGDDEGITPFPQKWREDSLELAKIPELSLPTTEYTKYGYSLTPAPHKTR